MHARRTIDRTSLCVLAVLTCAGAAVGQTVTRESIGPSNVAPLGIIVAGSGASDSARISPSGSQIVFRTSASNWQDGTSTGLGGSRVILRNRASNAISLLNGYGTASPPFSGSLLNQGTPSQLAYRGGSALWVISGNVNAAFELCPDLNNVADIFDAGSATPFSSGPGGSGGCPTPADGSSANPSIAADGLRAVFDSASTTFSAGGGSARHVYAANLTGGKNYTRKSVTGSILSGITAGNADSVNPSAGGGRSIGEDYVTAFESLATNLVAGDTNGARDIFARVDPNPGGVGLIISFTERVSVSSAGTQANGASFNPNVSANGRYVVFSSDATNLVAGDTNGLRDVFIRDRLADTTTRLSRSFSGAQANGSSDNPVINADGTWVAFDSAATNLIDGFTPPAARQVYLVHVPSGSVFLCSYNYATAAAGAADSQLPSISDDGLRVAFESTATNLVAIDINAVKDVFVYTRPNIPGNDQCGTNALLAPSGTVNGSTAGALPTAGLTGLCGSSAGSPDAWYAFTSPCTGSVTFTTAGSDYDTNLSVWTGCGAAGPIVCNDDVDGSPLTSSVTFNVVAEQQYFIRVGGFQNRSGNYTLTWAFAEPANNFYCNATPVSNGSYVVATCNATTDGFALAGCGSATNAFNDVWFRYTAPATGPVNIDVCDANFDAVLAVYSGACPQGFGTLLACDSSFCGMTPRLTLNATAGTVYSIRVGGDFANARGTGTLQIGDPPCNPADIATTDGTPGADTQINNGDFQLFFGEFFGATCAGCGFQNAPKCTNADIAATDGTPGHDGCVDNGDFSCFFANFFQGCP